MTTVIGKNVNVNDLSNSSTVSCNSTTRTTILAAQVPGDALRIKVMVTNKGNRGLWVALEPAAANNDKKSIRIPPGGSTTIISDADIYTGEISAIFQSGPAADVVVEWY